MKVRSVNKGHELGQTKEASMSTPKDEIHKLLDRLPDEASLEDIQYHILSSMPYLTHRKFPLPLDSDQVAQDWRRRGYSCDLFTDPPGREWNDFVHSTNELVTVVDGRLRVTIDGEEITVEPGDEVLIPRDVRHSVKNICSSTTHWLYGYD